MKIVLIVFMVLCTSKVFAVNCEERVLGYNMLLTGLATWGFSKINGERADWKTFAWGGLAGAGHHYARKSIRNGNEAFGVAQSYLWASVTENVTLGERPFGYVRYGVGPFSFRTKMSLKDFSVTPEVDALDLLRIINRVIRNSVNDLTIRRGVLVGRTRISDSTSATSRGSVVELTDNLERFGASTEDVILRHEVMHVAQFIQWSSFGATRIGKRKLNKHIRIGWMHRAMLEFDNVQDRNERYTEREVVDCNPGLTIQKRF